MNLSYADPARQPRKFSLTAHMQIEPCLSKDVKELLKFHYLNTEAAAAAKVFKMTLNEELVGCIVFTTVASLDSGIRAKFFPEYRDIKNTEGSQFVNKARAMLREKSGTNRESSLGQSLTKREGSFFCRYCGTENEPDAVYCEKCGKKVGR